MDQITCLNCDKTGELPVSFCCEECAEQWALDRTDIGNSSEDEEEDEEEEDGHAYEDE